MVDGAVGVRQLVTERDDGRDVGNLRGEHGPMLHGDAEGLADDFELPFDRGAPEGIAGVVFETFPLVKSANSPKGPSDARRLEAGCAPGQNPPSPALAIRVLTFALSGGRE